LFLEGDGDSFYGKVFWLEGPTYSSAFPSAGGETVALEFRSFLQHRECAGFTPASLHRKTTTLVF